MIKLSEETRKIFRAIFRGVGALTVSLSLGACPIVICTEEPAMYGMPPDIIIEDIQIRGTVINKQADTRLYNIAVYIEAENFSCAVRTSTEGNFGYYVPIKDSYTLIFTDIDGDKNGRYKQHTIKITRKEAEALWETPLLITLDEETDEA